MSNIADISAPHVEFLVRAHRQIVTEDLGAWDDVWSVVTVLDSGEMDYCAVVTVGSQIFEFGSALGEEDRSVVLGRYAAWRSELAGNGLPVWRMIALHTNRAGGTYEFEFAHDGTDTLPQWLEWAQTDNRSAQIGRAMALMPAG